MDYGKWNENHAVAGKHTYHLSDLYLKNFDDLLRSSAKKDIGERQTGKTL